MRAPCTLPGGIGRLVPCRIGANHCRLKSFGYEKCGHGLISRPRETAEVTFLDECLFYFGTLLGLLLRCWRARCPEVIVRLGLQVRSLLGDCPLLVGLLVLSLMVVRRLVWFGLSHEIVLVLLACMIVLVLTGCAGLVGVANEFD